MIPDAECIRVISEILSDLKLGKFAIKVSDFVFVYPCTARQEWNVVHQIIV